MYMIYIEYYMAFFISYPFISPRSWYQPASQTRRIQLFYKIFALKIINYQFLSYDIESGYKNMHLLDLYIKTIIFLFYNYM
jgi:hypothetical protein